MRAILADPAAQIFEGQHSDPNEKKVVNLIIPLKGQMNKDEQPVKVLELGFVNAQGKITKSYMSIGNRFVSSILKDHPT